MVDISHKPSTQITFEHPAGDEQVRLYLRLEYLYTELKKHMKEESVSHSKNAMTALLKILNVIDRPDLKSKLVQTLTSHATNLSQLIEAPNVNKVVLEDILQRLYQHIHYLHNYQGKIGESLRKNEFLTQIRLHLNNPAGANEYTLPTYHLWLSKPGYDRIQDLQLWSHPLLDLGSIIEQLLNLMRKSTEGKKVVAKNGFYQQDQDIALPCKLLRVSLPAHLGMFPQVSANKHSIHIILMEPDFYHGNKPTQVKNDIEFELTCCRL